MANPLVAPLASPSGETHSQPRLILRLEGAALLAAAVAAYAVLGESWWLFALLFLAPDLSMLGYLAGPRIGAVCYNLGHTTLIGGTIAAAGFLAEMPIVNAIGLVWLAHIGFDRLLGYGLKYPDAFSHTHLGRLGGGKR
jgi:hypothetical protein